MQARQKRTRSWSRHLTLGVLSLPLFVVGGCLGGLDNDQDNGTGLVDGTGGSGGPPGSSPIGGSSGDPGGSTGGGGPSSGAGGSGPGAGGSVGAGGSSGGGTGVDENCTDEQHPENLEHPCSIWLEWGNPPGSHCNDEWLQGYCDATCGRCQPGSGSGGSSGGGGGSSGGGGSGGGFGDGGPNLPNITGGDVYHATRYWDCCKTHCAWQGTENACQSNGTTHASPDARSACEAGGQAFACYNDAPYAVSNTVSYGHIAAPPGPHLACGRCYHLQFTGEGHYNASDPGSQALAGKHMIVKVSNTGSDVHPHQFDMMIPGGGVGQFDACSNQWGSSDLGARYGGFLSGDGAPCAQGGHQQRKECVRARCNAVIPAGPARDGCLWFVDWFEAADNPKFRFEQISCPSGL